MMASRRVATTRVTAAGIDPASRTVPDEVPVALVHDGSTHAVMLATPADLEDFAYGFAVTEGVVDRLDQIRDTEVVVRDQGIEVRQWLTPEAAQASALRRRRMTGPTGCGLCGVESLAAAVPVPPRVAAGGQIAAAEIHAALAALSARQILGIETRATHAAAFWQPGSGLGPVREDVGRHNALDKLVGAMLRAGREAGSGMVLITSRVSVEMVQKTARLGAPVLVAVSAPTSLAIQTAEAAGITLVGIARADGFEIFTHPARILPQARAGLTRPGRPRHVA